MKFANLAVHIKDRKMQDQQKYVRNVKSAYLLNRPGVAGAIL